MTAAPALNTKSLTADPRNFELGSWIGWIVGLTAIALALRWIAIERHSFWYDEAYAAALTHSSYLDLLTGAARDNGNPPLYWILAKAWSSIFGQSEVGFRSLSAICGALVVPLLGSIGRRLFTPLNGLLAAALFAISPLSIELSNEARTYASQCMFGVLATLLLLRWLDSGRQVDLLLYTVAVVLVVYSHYFGFVIPLAHLALLLATRPRTRRALLPWYAAMLAVAVASLPWLPTFVRQLSARENGHGIAQTWETQFAATPVVLALGRTFAWRDSSRWMLIIAILAAVSGFWLPAVWAFFHSVRQRAALVLLATWILAPIALPLGLAIIGITFYQARYASIALPALALLVARGLETLPRHQRLGIAGVIVSCTAVSLARYNTEPLKDDWRSAAPVVLSQAKIDEPILFDTDIEVTSFMYFAPKSGRLPVNSVGLTQSPDQAGRFFGVRYRDGHRVTPDPVDCTESVSMAPGVWIILCVPAGRSGQYEILLRQAGYAPAGSWHFHRIDIYHFLKPATTIDPSAH